uniref:Uncharacterized protein n=1 Tax=Triticum urartu TaxID=4572 RepID=A0A8R7TXQ2_TRIUA
MVRLHVYVHGAVDAVVDGPRVVGHHGGERLELGQLQVGVRRYLREVPVHELGHHGDRSHGGRRRGVGQPQLAPVLCQRRRRVPGPQPVHGRHEVVQYPLHAVDVVQRVHGVAEVGHQQVLEAGVLQLRADAPLQVLPAQRAGVEEHGRAEQPQQELGGGDALLGRQQRNDLLQEVPLVAVGRPGEAGGGGARGGATAAGDPAVVAAEAGVAEAGAAVQAREEPPRVEHDGAGDALGAHALGLHGLDQPLEHGQAQERHVLVPPVHGRGRGRCRRAARRVARADAVPERVPVEAGALGAVGGPGGGVGGAGLGGERGDAAGDDLEVLGGREHALAGLQRPDGVLPVGEHVGEERLGLRDQVALRVVVRHAQVLGGAPEAHHVERVELDLDVVAEARRQLERLGAARDVVQLQRAHAAAVRRRLVLADQTLQHAAPAQQRELHAHNDDRCTVS